MAKKAVSVARRRRWRRLGWVYAKTGEGGGTLETWMGGRGMGCGKDGIETGFGAGEAGIEKSDKNYTGW